MADETDQTTPDLETLQNTGEEQPSSPERVPDNTNWAMWSLVCGILGFFLPIIGLILSILAIVFYFKQKKIAPSGLATAGLVLGIINIVLIVIVILLFSFGAFMFFGIMEPASYVPGRGGAPRFTPDMCTIVPPFSCNDYRVTGSAVMVALSDYGPTPSTASRAELRCGDNSYIAEGDGALKFTWKDYECELENNRLSAEFSLYVLENGEEHAYEGSIRAHVE